MTCDELYRRLGALPMDELRACVDAQVAPQEAIA